MAFTVTVTGGGVSFQRGVDLYVVVLTNATEACGASNGGANASGAAASGSLTPNFSASYVGFSISADGITSMPAAAANNTYDYSPGGHADTWVYRAGHYSGTVTGGTPLTYGAGSAGSGDHENWCAYEVPASGGTITVDGSSPAGVTGDTSASSTTGSFTPPAGSVLLVMAAFGGSGAGAGQNPTISDTSGLGIIWTRRIISSSSDNFQVTAIWTATVPASPPQGPAGNPPLGWPALLTSRFGPVEPFRTPQQFSVDPPPQLAVNAGVATVGAVAVAPMGFNPFLTSTGGTGYNAWLQDQYGTPRLMLSEQAWALPWNAGRWNSGDWQSDFTAYFSTRASQGYNAWYGIVWGNTHVDSAALSGGRSWDGVFPLNINGTPGAIATGSETVTLNNTFWARIDAFLQTAMRYGVTVFMNLSMSYDVSDVGGIWQHATNTQGTAFGNALATRYPQGSWPNLQWFFGDDDDGPNDSFYQAILTGIQNAGDTRALISIEQFTNTNCHVSFDTGGAFSGTFGAPDATYNWGYCYDAPYFGMERSYTEGGSFTHIIPVYGDGIYYGDTGSGTTADRIIRNFVWWAISSGARGITSTSGPSDLGGGGLWTWQSGAVARLTSDPNGDGTWTTSKIGAIRSYIAGLADWHKLIPDTGNALLTAGRGTRGTSDAAGGAFNFRNTNNYVAGSITPGGTLAVIYCKAAMSITIDQTKMSAGYTATWVDPYSLAQTGTSTGTTYASSGLGNNAAGDPDWVLVLQGPPAANPAPPAAAAAVKANAPSTAVTVTAGVAAVAAAVTAPTVAAAANITAARVSAVASQPSDAVTANSAVAAVLAAVTAPAAAETVTAEVAIVGSIALAPTVNTSGNTNAPAGVAAVAAAAAAPVPAVTTGAAAAAVLGAVTAAKAAATGTAAAAAVTTAALAPAPAITTGSGAAIIGSTAPAATVSTSSGTTAHPGVAAVTAAATGPVLTITVTTTAANVFAAAPAATGPTPAVQNAVSHPAVTGQTAGSNVTGAAHGSAVTEQAATSPAVSGG